MALPNLYSRRRREAANGSLEVYQYDEVSDKLRVQMIQILRSAIGSYDPSDYSNTRNSDIYKYIVETLREEIGTFCLTRLRPENLEMEFFGWFGQETDVDRLIDGIELSMRIIDTYIRDNMFSEKNSELRSPDDAINAINARMKEDSFGYQYEEGQIIRVDSGIIHREVMIPALRILSESKFKNANREFRDGHLAYREGRTEDCLIACAKAFESVLKVIASKRKWKVQETATAKVLLDAAYANEFFSNAVAAGLNSLRSLLETAVPTPRNKSAGHGAGVTSRDVPTELAAFQLHQTAAVIIFLAATDAGEK